MLEFYEFNTFNICVVMISTFLIYYILSNTIGNGKDDGNGNDESGKSDINEFSVEYLLISVVLSVGISLGISYVMSGSDEALLTDNYWENNNIE